MEYKLHRTIQNKNMGGGSFLDMGTRGAYKIGMGNCNKNTILKGVFAKNERGYRLNAIKKRF